MITSIIALAMASSGPLESAPAEQAAPTKFLIVACGFQRVLVEKPVNLARERYTLGFALGLPSAADDTIRYVDPNNLLDSQPVTRMVLATATSLGWVADGPEGKTVEFALTMDQPGSRDGLASLRNAREPDGTRGNYIGKCTMGPSSNLDGEFQNLIDHKVL